MSKSSEMDVSANPVVKQLVAAFPGEHMEPSAAYDELTVEVPAHSVFETLEHLRDASAPRFRMLADLTAVDRYPLEPRFEIVYHLLALEGCSRLRVKARIHGDAPEISSVVSLWPAANMLEREVFDLFGVQFKNHPNLSRLLMPEDWQGHPLRKDYPVEGER